MGECLLQRKVLAVPITYNANGHGTAPAAQKKGIGKTINLQPFIATSTSTAAGSTISFNVNGGESATPASKSSTITYTYTQTQWNTAADGSGTGYGSGAAYSLNKKLNLYAIWNTTTNYSTITMPPAATKSGGYVCVGWNTKSDGTGTTFTNGTTYDPDTYTELKTTRTLYAKWGLPTTTTVIEKRSGGAYSANYSWTADPNSYYTIWMWGYDDENQLTSQGYQLVCDGTTMSIAQAVANGYVQSFTYKPWGLVNDYTWGSYGTNVIFNTSAHNGNITRVTVDSGCCGYGVEVVTVLGKNVSGLKERFTVGQYDEGQGEEHYGYTLKKTTYA